MTGIPRFPSMDMQPPSWWPSSSCKVTYVITTRQLTDQEIAKQQELKEKFDEAFRAMCEVMNTLSRDTGASVKPKRKGKRRG